VSQTKLLGLQRFAPLFWTQFLGAFNDNLYKNALVILVAYREWSLGSLDSRTIVPMGAGLFILPYFLFSATAGQLADRLPKTVLIRWVKVLEIVLMISALLGFLFDSLGSLLITLFMMGLQSTFFGPAKYSVLPELLSNDELTGGNALVELGTFLAILLGTVAGGALIALDSGSTVVGLAVIVVAVAGWLTSQWLPFTPGANPRLKIDVNPIVPLKQTLSAIRCHPSVLLSILAISWFWFFGASLLTVLPSYSKDVLHGNEHVVTLLLGLFCVGIALGSLLCERLGKGQLEIGLVPLGAVGMSLATIDLCIVGSPPALANQTTLIGLGTFLATPGSWRLIVDFLLLAVCGGLNTVPLYTLMQQRAPGSIRSRVIASNNILNACFMVASAGLLMAAAKAGISIPSVFGLLALSNALFAIVIYAPSSEFSRRVVALIVTHVLVRARIDGRNNIPQQGPALLVAKQGSPLDPLLLSSITPRPILFALPITEIPPALRLILRGTQLDPAIGRATNELDQAGAAIAENLAAGNLVCVFVDQPLSFPKGQTAPPPTRPNIKQILEIAPAPVISIALERNRRTSIRIGC